MQAIAFYAELLGFVFVVFALPAALYCFLGGLVRRELKPLARVCVALGIWVVVFMLRLRLVPDGATNASQYMGLAGVMQILFFAATSILLVLSIRTLRQQTSIPK